MTEAERCIWAQAQTDYSQAVAISLKVWGDQEGDIGTNVPYEVIQSGAATVIIHVQKLREQQQRLPRGAEPTPSAPPVAVSSGGQVNLRQPSKAPAGVPPCPQCNGKMWDNRGKKRNPKAPDFVCRDKQCLDPTGKFTTALWEKDLKPSPVMAAAISRTLAEVPVALDDDGEDSLPF